MVEKKLWVYLLAYNLIRLLMAAAAVCAKTTGQILPLVEDPSPSRQAEETSTS